MYEICDIYDKLKNTFLSLLFHMYKMLSCLQVKVNSSTTFNIKYYKKLIVFVINILYYLIFILLKVSYYFIKTDVFQLQYSNKSL